MSNFFGCKNFSRLNFYKQVIVLILATIYAGMGGAAEADQVCPESFGLVDGLGRTWLPPSTQSIKAQKPRFVAMFYWTWHGTNAASTPPRNASEVLAAHPDATNDFTHPAWQDTPSTRTYFWSKPLFGYYSTCDEYVLHKHLELLANAGVDVIVFDATNGTWLWQDSFDVLLKVLDQAKADGIKTPKFAFMLNFAPNRNSLEQLRRLWRDLYSIGRGREHWFMWDGKPLIMAHPECLSRNQEDTAIARFLTFRHNDPSYFSKDTKFNALTWGWCSVWPQTRFGVRRKTVEQMCVSVAQNANATKLTAMNDPAGGVRGRSYASGNYSLHTNLGTAPIVITKNNPDAMRYGINFQQQWDRVLANDPKLVFVTGWNEWVAGRHQEWAGVKNAFPDQFSPEYSRDIEPATVSPGDDYYYQLFENVRRYKHDAVALPVRNARRTIAFDAVGDAWEGVEPVFRDYRRNTPRRDAAGYKGEHYIVPEMKNDIVASRVAYDDKFVYFMAELTTAPTAPDSPAWMRLFIDTDFTGASPHWEGFEYVVNRVPPSGGKAILEKFLGGWKFAPAIQVDYQIRGNRVELKIPRQALGFQLKGKVPRFGFKWADGNAVNGDIRSFYKTGEAAPGGRFRYIFAP